MNVDQRIDNYTLLMIAAMPLLSHIVASLFLGGELFEHSRSVVGTVFPKIGWSAEIISQEYGEMIANSYEVVLTSFVLWGSMSSLVIVLIRLLFLRRFPPRPSLIGIPLRDALIVSVVTAFVFYVGFSRMILVSTPGEVSLARSHPGVFLYLKEYALLIAFLSFSSLSIMLAAKIVFDGVKDV